MSEMIFESTSQPASCTEGATTALLPAPAPGRCAGYRSRLQDLFVMLWTTVRAAGLDLLYSYSSLLFGRSGLLGLILLICSFLNLNPGIAGIVSWLAAIGFCGLLGIKKGDPVRSICEYNALIVGFSIGFLYRFSFLSVFLVTGASFLTVLVGCMLYSLLYKKFRLPVLNLPFLICSTIIYLASVRYSSLFVDSFYVHNQLLNLNALPQYVQGLLRSTGYLIFMPYDICGIFMLAGLLIFSRIAFFAAVASYYIGTTATALLTGSFTNAFSNLYSFNFILTGIAIAAVFLVPSRRSYLFAFLSVLLSVFVMDAAFVVCNQLGAPIFTLPFNLMVLLIIYVLMQTGYPEITQSIKSSPEASLSNHLNFSRRFDRIFPRPFLPFSGRWTVYQAFDGKWTHKGIWKYAYDFFITDESGRTHQNGGDLLEDYYCYGKPILAPVSGTVVDVGDSLQDNPPGEVDNQSNWGNYIVLHSLFGYYVEISHLKHGSLQVKTGDSVTAGEVIAACGNSGHSAQPHIHMQVQYSPEPGSESGRFYLSNCLDGGRLLRNKVLEEGRKVEPLSVSRGLSKKLAFVLDDTFTFKVLRDGTETGEARIVVKMARDGSRYLTVDGTQDRLYYGSEDNCFVFYSLEGSRNSPLRLLFAALPRIPLCNEGGVSWEDLLPDDIVSVNVWRKGFLRSFHHDLGKITGKYTFVSAEEIRGEISNGYHLADTSLVLDEQKGFREVLLKTSKGTFGLEKSFTQRPAP
ncbi:MAG: urea transporter [Syntrophobacteraceae bacterium]